MSMVVLLVNSLDDADDAVRATLPSASLAGADGDGVLETATVALVDALPKTFSTQSTNRRQTG